MEVRPEEVMYCALCSGKITKAEYAKWLQTDRSLESGENLLKQKQNERKVGKIKLTSGNRS